jgi:hypothetical protein
MHESGEKEVGLVGERIAATLFWSNIVDRTEGVFEKWARRAALDVVVAVIFSLQIRSHELFMRYAKMVGNTWNVSVSYANVHRATAVCALLAINDTENLLMKSSSSFVYLMPCRR